MSIYAYHGYKDFVLALGYLGDVIKKYFVDYHALNSDLSVNLANGEVTYQKPCRLDWTINLVDTGGESMTGGRVLRLADLLRPHGTFMLTYGDGVANIDIGKLVEFHRSHGKICTVTSVRPTARFGGLGIDSGKVTSFREKPQSGEGWINGGFFVMEPRVFDYISDDRTVLEQEPLEKLAAEGELMAYQHGGFWQCMDTIRERHLLESVWASGSAPWKLWT
jgi:glucose-1-phosphate cytidylyltransferase